MTAKKALEILELNLKEAGKKMPADCREALRLGCESLNRQLLVRKNTSFIDPGLLPGETPDE